MKVRKDSGFTKEQNRTIDDGEFACMPGSHKANYACPDEVRLHNEARERIVQIPANAGDAVESRGRQRSLRSDPNRVQLALFGQNVNSPRLHVRATMPVR